MKWWDYLWLNEGFASYVEYVGTVKVEPDWGMVRIDDMASRVLTLAEVITILLP